MEKRYQYAQTSAAVTAYVPMARMDHVFASLASEEMIVRFDIVPLASLGLICRMETMLHTEIILNVPIWVNVIDPLVCALVEWDSRVQLVT